VTLNQSCQRALAEVGSRDQCGQFAGQLRYICLTGPEPEFMPARALFKPPVSVIRAHYFEAHTPATGTCQ